MVTRALLRYIRISPRKFRQVIPLIKGKHPEEAMVILSTIKKGGAKYAIDLLRAAIANTKRLPDIDSDRLYISSLIANGGPQLKRFRAASMGRASPIRKRTSHIILELDLKPATESHAQPKGKAAAKQTPAAPAASAQHAPGDKAKKPKAKEAAPKEKGTK